MDLVLMRSLMAVAEHGAISEAAQAIGLSQPALSRRIQQLEEEFGTALLERSRRGAVLTEMGRLVVREGQAMVGRYERLKDSVDAHLRFETGIVRVGGGATAVSYLLPRAIAAFQRSHPKVLFQLKEEGSREVAADVLEERLELGIVTLPVQSQDLLVQPLFHDRIVLAAARNHPLASCSPVKVSALNDQRVVGFEADSAIRRLIDGALRDAGVQMQVFMELRSIAAILQLVATTGSLAFVSELGASDRRVRVLDVRGLKISRQLALIQKRGRPPSPAAAAFSATLEDLAP